MKKKPHRTKAQKGATRKAQHASVRQERKHGPSPAQVSAARRNLRIARGVQHQNVVRAKHGKPPLPHRKPKLSPYEISACSAEAVAASLRLAGGYVSAEDMVGLYWAVASGPDDGADIEAVLLAARRGLAGWFPEFSRGLRPGSILVYQNWRGLDAHAVALHPAGGVVSWGELLQPPACPDEAWQVNWYRERHPVRQ